MNLKDKFNIVKKIKNSYNLELKKYSEFVLVNLINKLKKNKIIYNRGNLKTNIDKIAGVYLLYAFENDQLQFCYVGESNNTLNRFAQHILGFLNGKQNLYKKMRKKINDIKNLNLIILDKIKNQNKRLKKETYYIYTFKSRFYSLNSKITSIKIHCPNGHGRVRSYLDYQKDADQLKIFVQGKCLNKKCNAKFIIK